MSSLVNNKIEQLRRAILTALAFYDIFDYPLTSLEIYKFVQNEKGESFAGTFDLNDIVSVLAEDVLLQTRVTCRYGFYMLQGRESLYEARLGRHNEALKRWRKLQRLVKLVSGVPFLKMVAACNMFPIDTPSPQSDIDVFIVAKKGRIWLVRLLVTFLIGMTGQWRHKKVAGKVCLSFFVSDGDLDLKSLYKDKNVWLEPDPYLANWVNLVTPLYDRDNTGQAFREANGWVEDYIFNYQNYSNLSSRRLESGWWFRFWQIWGEIVMFGSIGSLLERFVRKMQLEYMKTRGDKEWLQNPNVIISDQMLKFHEIDRRELFRNKLTKNLSLRSE